MDITGKYAYIGLPEAEGWTLLGAEPRVASATRAMTLAGRCAGENAHGVWIAIDTVFGIDGSRLSPDDFNNGEPAITFVPWKSVRFATLFADPPCAGKPRLGFQAR